MFWCFGTEVKYLTEGSIPLGCVPPTFPFHGVSGGMAADALPLDTDPLPTRIQTPPPGYRSGCRPLDTYLPQKQMPLLWMQIPPPPEWRPPTPPDADPFPLWCMLGSQLTTPTPPPINPHSLYPPDMHRMWFLLYGRSKSVALCLIRTNTN